MLEQISHTTNGATETKDNSQKKQNTELELIYVELTSQNGCVYKQTFTISEAEDPTFDSVIELGNSITVNISGGNLLTNIL
jgi:hypothetical protein